MLFRCVYTDRLLCCQSNGALHNTNPQTIQLGAYRDSPCWRNSSTCQEFTPTNLSALPEGSNTTFYVNTGYSSLDIRSLVVFDYNVTVSNMSTSATGIDEAYNLITTIFWNTNITATFESVAASVTGFIRENSNSYKVFGAALQRETFVSVDWAWFALPAALILLCVAFIATVIITTAVGIGGEKFVWKDSSLPLLLHGSRGYIDTEILGEIEQDVKRITVQLKRDEKGYLRFEKTE